MHLYSLPNPDHCPSASTSDLVSFGGSEDELSDESMSLGASDAEELSGLVTDPALLPLSTPIAAKAEMDAELLRILSKAVKELCLEWSPPEEPFRSRLKSVPLHVPRRSMTSSQNHGLLPILLASMLLLYLTVLKKRDTKSCLP